jgi:hypothetical protein
MPTSIRVTGGSQVKGTKAIVVYPPEFSGSNAADRYLQGIECKTIESVYKYLAVKPQPINDNLRIRNGKIVSLDSIFDDADHETILRKDSVDNRVAVVFGNDNTSGFRSAINHGFDRRDLGQSIFRHHDGTPYEDNISENPIDVMNALDNEASFKVFSIDEHGFATDDAYIDPLGARPIARNVLVTRPFSFNGIKADISVNDNQGKSIVIEQSIERNDARVITLSDIRSGINRRDVYLAGTNFYVDGISFFTMASLLNPIRTEGFVEPDNAEILPFLDGSDIEISSVQVTDELNEPLKEALLELKPSMASNLFDRNHISCNAGFVYNNCSYGTDSLAFGGLKR